MYAQIHLKVPNEEGETISKLKVYIPDGLTHTQSVMYMQGLAHSLIQQLQGQFRVHLGK